MPQLEKTPAAMSSHAPAAELLPSQVLRAAVIGFCLGACVGVASFNLLLGALTRSLTPPILVDSSAEMAGTQSIHYLICGLAGLLVAVNGLVWSRSGRISDRMATTFVMAALALSSATVAVRLLRLNQPRPPKLPLPAGVPAPQMFVSVKQIPFLWPPVVACVVLIVALLLGMRQRRSSLTGSSVVQEKLPS